MLLVDGLAFFSTFVFSSESADLIIRVCFHYASNLFSFICAICLCISAFVFASLYFVFLNFSLQLCTFFFHLCQSADLMIRVCSLYAAYTHGPSGPSPQNHQSSFFGESAFYCIFFISNPKNISCLMDSRFLVIFLFVFVF